MSVISDKSIYINAIGQNAMDNLILSACTSPSIGVFMRSFVVPDCLTQANYDDLGANFIDPLNAWDHTNFVDLSDYMASPIRPGSSDPTNNLLRQNSQILIPLNSGPVTRTVGTAFQPQPSSTHKAVNCSYVFTTNVQSLLVGTAEVKIELFIGATSTPTMLADSARVKVAGVLNVNNTQDVSVKAKVPADWYAKLVVTNVSGTATATYSSGIEQVEG